MNNSRADRTIFVMAKDGKLCAGYMPTFRDAFKHAIELIQWKIRK